MLTVLGIKENYSLLGEELRIKWCTKFKLPGIWFDQTLVDINVNYENMKSKVKAIANSWKNRYVSIYRKVCVVKILMLTKLTHISTVLPTLETKQIKEIKNIWHDYISPIKGAARANIKPSMPPQHKED